MRRLTPLLVLPLLALLLVPGGCKRKKRPAKTDAPAAQSNSLASMVSTADPRASLQLVKGFYDIENNAWRWTAREFQVALRPPVIPSQGGANLVVHFAIPDVEIEKLKSLTLSVSVNGVTLPPETYDKAGDLTYSQPVPASAFGSDSILASFSLDKALPPTPTDGRELGIIVREIGFELH